MKWFHSVDDRFLMVVLTVSVLTAFLLTREKVFADAFTYCLGGTFGVLIARANKQLVVTGTDDQTKKIVSEFMAR